MPSLAPAQVALPATRRAAETLTDAELVAQVRLGCDRAFEQLYARYHRRIAAYVNGMVNDHARAEDIAQDVFISALRRMRDTDKALVFKPWLYEIAKNACIDQFRRARRTEEVSFDADGGLSVGDQGRLAAGPAQPTPDQLAEQKATLVHLQGAFGGLSETHHEILVMRELEGLSYREIGDKLSMSRPSVESTLFRARRRLTEEYEELVSGERCQRVQAIIASAASQPGGALGARDSRRLGAHISHCQPCRRHAASAGIDAASLVKPRLGRIKVAAFLPLPAFLRRRVGGGSSTPDDATTALPSAHLSQLANLSAQVGGLDPAVASWAKAAVAAATIAVAGVGAGAAVKQSGIVSGSHKHPAPPSAVKPARDAGAPPSGRGAKADAAKGKAGGASVAGTTGGQAAAAGASTPATDAKAAASPDGPTKGGDSGAGGPNTPAGGQGASASTPAAPSADGIAKIFDPASYEPKQDPSTDTTGDPSGAAPTVIPNPKAPPLPTMGDAGDGSGVAQGASDAAGDVGTGTAKGAKAALDAVQSGGG